MIRTASTGPSRTCDHVAFFINLQRPLSPVPLLYRLFRHQFPHCFYMHSFKLYLCIHVKSILLPEGGQYYHSVCGGRYGEEPHRPARVQMTSDFPDRDICGSRNRHFSNWVPGMCGISSQAAPVNQSITTRSQTHQTWLLPIHPPSRTHHPQHPTSDPP